MGVYAELAAEQASPDFPTISNQIKITLYYNFNAQLIKKETFRYIKIT